jgi:hypothetical protein
MRIDVSLEPERLDTDLAALHARMRDPEDALHSLPLLFTACPGFDFRFREKDGEFYVYVEDAERNVLAGCTYFNHALELDRGARRYLRSPHSRYSTAYSRQGLATAVYRWALDAGLCLMTGPRQSPAAHGLWIKLAREYEMVFVETGRPRLRIMGGRVEPCDFDGFNTRMVLLGAGWTLDELVRATNADELPSFGARQDDRCAVA